MPWPARVFISYSHESDDHQAVVRELADRLRVEGVNAVMDLYTEAPPEGWPRWVERQIASSDFVLCVCSPVYRQGFEGRNDGALGLGVNQEGSIILQDLYDSGNLSTKYIPVLFRGSEKDIPGSLRSFTRYFLFKDFDKLYGRLTHQAVPGPPSLGTPHPVPVAAQVSPVIPQSNGFTQQADITMHLLPSQVPLERLAPREGLYLSRLINPQPDGGRLTTVWLAARGNTDYIVDSVRIRHKLGEEGYGSLGGPVALAPDAAFKITFPKGSDAAYALDPALMIGPASRNWAWFTLSATSDQLLIYTKETITIWVQYQSMNGLQGTLLLLDVPATAARLAKVAQCDIRYTWSTDKKRNMATMLVTVEALQRGLESESTAPHYRALLFTGIDAYTRLNRDQIAFAQSEVNIILRDRTSLHDVLRQPSCRHRLSTWLQEGSADAASLVGALNDGDSLMQLLTVFDAGQKKVALAGLCARHTVAGDDALASLMLDRPADFDDEDFAQGLAALAVRFAPSRMEVIALFQSKTPDRAWPLLQALGEDLTLDEWEAWLRRPGGPLSTELFLFGSMNGWTNNGSNKFMYNGAGIYSVETALPPDKSEVKVGGKHWLGVNLGAAADAGPLALGEEVEMVAGELSPNVLLQVTVAGRYRFDFRVHRPNRLTLRIMPVSEVNSTEGIA